MKLSCRIETVPGAPDYPLTFDKIKGSPGVYETPGIKGKFWTLLHTDGTAAALFLSNDEIEPALRRLWSNSMFRRLPVESVEVVVRVKGGAP